MRHKRVVVTHYGGPEVITTIEQGIPTSQGRRGAGEGVGSGGQSSGSLAREGVHPETPRVPYTPGWDLALFAARVVFNYALA
jgi:hypothetical protein